MDADEKRILEELAKGIEALSDIAGGLAKGLKDSTTAINARIDETSAMWMNHERRLVELETVKRNKDDQTALHDTAHYRSPSFTNEVISQIGDSIRVPMAAISKTFTRQSIFSQLVTGIVLALAIIAMIVFAKRD